MNTLKKYLPESPKVLTTVNPDGNIFKRDEHPHLNVVWDAITESFNHKSQVKNKLREGAIS